MKERKSISLYEMNLMNNQSLSGSRFLPSEEYYLKKSGQIHDICQLNCTSNFKSSSTKCLGCRKL